MSRLLHLSDTHFGTELPGVCDALERLVAGVRPEVLVLSGDITQRATAAQFARARAWLDRLPVPHRLVIGGNHDIPLFDLAERLRHPYRRLSAAFGPEREPRLNLPDWQVLTLDTTRWWRHRDGTLSRAQIARTADTLQAAAPGQIRVVVTHHPLHVTRIGDEVHRPTHHRKALSAWAGAGADLLLSGHVHLPAVVPVAVEPEVSRRLWSVQAGTAVSHRLREGIPNSVMLLEALSDGHHGRQCCCETWQCPPEGGAFRRVASQLLALSPLRG
ncbi:metallophosphoesterase family protein [Sphaerotilus natans]|uniref:metallophosphoesterase family protein n=1 Tax=Sphaerotilus natans TaxID=34103 RepID=UPI00406C839E